MAAKSHSPFMYLREGQAPPLQHRGTRPSPSPVGAVHEPPVRVSRTSGRFMNRPYSGRACGLRAPTVGDGLAHPAFAPRKKAPRGAFSLPHSRKSNNSLGVTSSTSQSLKSTSKETPTLPSSMALMWLRSTSTSSANWNWVSRWRLR